MGKRAICLLSCWLGCGTLLLAQDAVRRIFPRPNFEWRTWDAHSSLSGGSIRSLVQADDGCIWILTVLDLIRYDGYEFKILPNPWKFKKGLVVDDLRKDPNGRLWLTTHDGAIPIDKVWPNPYDGDFSASFPQPLPLDHEALRLLPREDRRRLPDGIELPEGSAIGPVAAAVRDAKGDLWVGTETGLYRLIGAGKNPSADPFFTGDAVDVLLADREGALWIGTRNSGLAMLRRTVFGSVTFSGTRTDNNIRSVFVDRRGRAWAGTLNGKLLRFQSGGLREAPIDRDIFDDFMFTMADDANGDLLLGTEKQGLFRYRNGRLDRLRTREDSDEGAIVSLFTDSRGRTWLSRLGREFGVLEGGRFRRLLAKEDGFAHKMIFNVFEDSRRNLWLGHTGGLFRLDNGEPDRSRLTSFLEDVPVSSIHEDRDGILWLGTYGRGLVRFNPRNAESFFFPEKRAWAARASSGYLRTAADDSGSPPWTASFSSPGAPSTRPPKAAPAPPSPPSYSERTTGFSANSAASSPRIPPPACRMDL